MKNLIYPPLAIMLVTLTLASCASVNNSCHLMHVAYNEQDELAEGWYASTAAFLKKECSVEVADPQFRGRDPNGNYNADKQVTKRKAK